MRKTFQNIPTYRHLACALPFVLAALPLFAAGGGNRAFGEYFIGRIDEVRVYDRPLTGPEIAADAATPVVP